MIVTCQLCGKEIESERASRKFCDECRKDRKKAVTARTYPQWYESKGTAYHKQWRDGHSEYRKRANARSAKRFKDNPELKKIADARYYQRHKEQINAHAKVYAKANRDKLRPAKQASLIRYRARLAKAEGNWTTKEFKELCESTGNRCWYCHKQTDRLTADHMLPLSRGGSNDITNIAPACMSCNAGKGATTPLEFLSFFNIS